ncbi:MAG TPA: DsrE family protein [Rhizomicrobium sp.]|nr:DsrE family protein [Rhizomicrobium sp.]
MRKLLACTILLAGLLGLSGVAMAQDLPIPGVAPAKDQPGAHEYPDPKLTYKIVFDLADGPASPDKVNPGLQGVAEFINTLAKYGVPADHRIIAVVFHQKSTPAILVNDEYRKRYNTDNPDIQLVQAMKKAGVDFRVCGQAVLGNHIDPKTIQPEIELDLWAGITIPNLMMRGYQHLGG